jgi:hypothetical protein
MRGFCGTQSCLLVFACHTAENIANDPDDYQNVKHSAWVIGVVKSYKIGAESVFYAVYHSRRITIFLLQIRADFSDVSVDFF